MLFGCLFVCFVCLFVCFVCLFVCVFVCLLVCLFVCLCVYVCVFVPAWRMACVHFCDSLVEIPKLKGRSFSLGFLFAGSPNGQRRKARQEDVRTSFMQTGAPLASK